MTERPPTLVRPVAGVTDSRRIAADVCADLRGGKLLDVVLRARVSPLDARDRRWTQELVFGMLRQRSILDAYLSDRVSGGLVRLDPDLGRPAAPRRVSAALHAQRAGVRGHRADGGAGEAAPRHRREQARERRAAPRRSRARRARAAHAHRSRGRARAPALASALARGAMGRALGRRGDGAAAHREQHRAAARAAAVRHRARAARGDARERGRRGGREPARFATASSCRTASR